FVEQCANLLAPYGVGAIAVPASLKDEPKAKTLRAFLREKAHRAETEYIPLSEAETKADLLLWNNEG
ncbi:MAG: hypothetical protein ABG776_11870, partial [Cyanobacteria bacterium J06555_13]